MTRTGAVATIPPSAPISFKCEVDGQPGMTNPENTPGGMTTTLSGVDNSADDSLQSSNSNARVVQPNGTQATLPLPSLSTDTRQENSNLEAPSHQSQTSGGYQLLKVAFVVVVGVGIALYLFDPKVRQWIFSHYIRIFQSSQLANTSALATKVITAIIQHTASDSRIQTRRDSRVLALIQAFKKKVLSYPGDLQRLGYGRCQSVRRTANFSTEL